MSSTITSFYQMMTQWPTFFIAKKKGKPWHKIHQGILSHDLLTCMKDYTSHQQQSSKECQLFNLFRFKFLGRGKTIQRRYCPSIIKHFKKACVLLLKGILLRTTQKIPLYLYYNRYNRFTKGHWQHFQLKSEGGVKF